MRVSSLPCKIAAVAGTQQDASFFFTASSLELRARKTGNTFIKLACNFYLLGILWIVTLLTVQAK